MYDSYVNNTIDAGIRSNKHTVTFNTYGGLPQPAQQTVDHGGFAIEPDEDHTPSKDNYRFLGWYTEENGDTEFDFDEPILEDTVVHAKYIRQYKVEFKTYGGTPVPITQYIDKGSSAVRPTTNPDLTGKDFVNWYTEEENGALFDFTQEIHEDKVIHAQYTGATIDVTFNTYGGLPQTPKQTIPYNTNPTKPDTSFNPVKDDYRFLGWYEADLETEFDFTKNLTVDTVVHAKYIRQYKVEFKTYGGTPVPTTQYIDKGSRAVRPTTNPDITGKDFVNWYTAETNGTLFDFTQEIHEDKVVHAQYTGSTIDVTFNTYGGLPQAPKQTIPYNTNPTKPDASFNPVKDDYRFVGWYEADLETEFDFSKNLITDTVVHAKYIRQYKVEFKTYGGTPVPVTQYVDKGSLAVRPSTNPDLTGKEFVNWYKEEENGALFDFTQEIHEDKVIHAQYIESPLPGVKYKVTFHYNDGITSNLVKEVSENTTVSEPLKPKWENHDFEGWFTDDQTFLDEYDFDTLVTRNLDLYAKWSEDPVIPDPDEKITVTFVPNNKETSFRVSINKNTAVLKPSDPSYEGYSFKGWYEDDVTFTSLYDFETVLNSDKTLYGKWEKNDEVDPKDPDEEKPKPETVTTGIDNKIQLYVSIVLLGLIFFVQSMNRKKI